MRARLERRAARVVPRISAICASGTLSPVIPSLSCSAADIEYSAPHWAAEIVCPGSWGVSLNGVGIVNSCAGVRIRTTVSGFTWAFNSRNGYMKGIFLTLGRLLAFTCTGLVVITVGASHFAGVPHVVEAMACAAAPAVLVAAVAETLVLGIGRG